MRNSFHFFAYKIDFISTLHLLYPNKKIKSMAFLAIKLALVAKYLPKLPLFRRKGIGKFQKRLIFIRESAILNMPNKFNRFL